MDSPDDDCIPHAGRVVNHPLEKVWLATGICRGGGGGSSLHGKYRPRPTQQPSANMETVAKPTLYTPLSREDLALLQRSKHLLEHPGLATKLSQIIGRPLEAGMKRLPQGFQGAINSAIETAMQRAMDAAVWSMSSKPGKDGPSNKWHKAMVGLSGGVGGAFGLPALLVELPISTSLMLRSIADIARHNGFEPANPATRLDCLQVFALGGPGDLDDGAESSYWATRLALGQLIRESLAQMTGRAGVSGATGPLAKMISSVAARLGVVISEQTAAKAVPGIGAATGAAINILFMSHFQNVAKGHFAIRRLEEKYGAGTIESAYLCLTPPSARPRP